MQVNAKQASTNFNQAATLLDEIERLVIATLGPDTDVTQDYLKQIDELRDELVSDIVEFDSAV